MYSAIELTKLHPELSNEELAKKVEEWEDSNDLYEYICLIRAKLGLENPDKYLTHGDYKKMCPELVAKWLTEQDDVDLAEEIVILVAEEL